MSVLDEIRGRLVVSCQADPGEPLDDPAHMVALARSARCGGAAGIRAQGVRDLRALRAALPDTPLIGLVKDGASGVYITPTLGHALAVAETGVDIVALDGTTRPRPDGRTLAATVAAVRARYDVLVMADVASVADADAAVAAGVDLVGTTLSGYTGGAVPHDPDLDLVGALAARLDVPVVAEGRINTPEEAAEALRRGAHAVVVGTAITRPAVVTGRFAAALLTSRELS
ncbi:N-acetylmannosamine-6-phosphate 2-epimerase [Micromonospora endolithica]|uniref:Putative N-acetylmannosamine-6-phosphate 2-epimerase n=1 Tax=Micromonospora endolithica TaxID=230091 RepID=A0A3A9YWU4_9ACTN|nr:N-acetylmannosamine-6-phosphate 2-epimerase [Micromonospora endolithica]RKN40572.1 N-acetylmannosamine-6-phosphate 2-epimerase [Micromonospora endolithica]TWJ21649.1 N-acylglucosamine-6-phosphate 2-epimerase [Micromonospora endolithica]